MTENNYTNDPVCKMYLENDDKIPVLTYDGINYKFCSEECLNIFKLNPENYTTNN